MNNLTSFELSLITECNILNDRYDNVCELLEKEREKNRKLKNHHKSSINLIQQVNTSVLKKNSTLTKRLHEINHRVYNIITNETIALFNDIYDATKVCDSYQSQDVRIQRIPGKLE